jgi:thiamine biosynthesis lipoprotein
MVNPFDFHFFAMGSPCALTLFADARMDAGTIAAASIAEVERIEQAYSRYRPDSIVSAINAAAREGGEIEADPETAFLIDHAFEIYQLSDGLFDITSGVLRRVWNDAAGALPDKAAIATLLKSVGLTKTTWRRPRLSFTIPEMEIDFGGIAKEYAADRAAAICRSLGVMHGVVDLGGDLAVIGPNPDGSPWRIGISDPKAPQTAIATLFVAEGGVATSGDYEHYWELGEHRYGHILNPHTGWPVEGLPSVTVAAHSCLAAGAFSTVAILKADEGIPWLRDHAPAHLYIDRAHGLGGSALDAEQSPLPKRSKFQTD